MVPAKEKSICDRIDDINNQKSEEQYNQLFNELSDLKTRRGLNKERIDELLNRLDYLRREIERVKVENP